MTPNEVSGIALAAAMLSAQSLIATVRCGNMTLNEALDVVARSRANYTLPFPGDPAVLVAADSIFANVESLLNQVATSLLPPSDP